MMSSLTIAVVAGEVSGDLLAGDLVAALKQRYPGQIELIGVGGDSLQAEGLRSLFDFAELSVMGITQVLERLPTLVKRIRQTADAIVQARPDLLLIVDSPDFTHRVARRVRAKLPTLPVVNYVCPSVWAWKDYRAKQMCKYVDRVLAVLPFEPAEMQRLGGPPTDYVGHRLVADRNLLNVRQRRAERLTQDGIDLRTVMLLPGSRSSEITRLIPSFRQAVDILAKRHPGMRFTLPTVTRRAEQIRALVSQWEVKPEIFVGETDKWQAFATADAAMAASGTVILELGLAGIPTVSAYKTDWIIKLLAGKIKTWSAALPNLIADYPVVPEYLNEVVRGGSLARWIERLGNDTLQRRAMIEGFDLVWERMQTELPPGEKAAGIVLDLLQQKSRAR
ncbi:lipid-A-disaccharide synthase [Oryzifoliimicrobium ureilyticus]|uniref:lipid-A-disaccharide synthase n=1 Tax=Oryzifoliimicrobium ureilyticus TaxID=3113724 RepID=UPI003F66565C